MMDAETCGAGGVGSWTENCAAFAPVMRVLQHTYCLLGSIFYVFLWVQRRV